MPEANLHEEARLFGRRWWIFAIVAALALALALFEQIWGEHDEVSEAICWTVFGIAVGTTWSARTFRAKSRPSVYVVEDREDYP